MAISSAYLKMIASGRATVRRARHITTSPLVTFAPYLDEYGQKQRLPSVSLATSEPTDLLRLPDVTLARVRASNLSDLFARGYVEVA